MQDYHLTISATKLTLNCSTVSPLSVNIVLNCNLAPTSASSLGGVNWNVTGTVAHDSTDPYQNYIGLVTTKYYTIEYSYTYLTKMNVFSSFVKIRLAGDKENVNNGLESELAK